MSLSLGARFAYDRLFQPAAGDPIFQRRDFSNPLYSGMTFISPVYIKDLVRSRSQHFQTDTDNVLAVALTRLAECIIPGPSAHLP